MEFISTQKLWQDFDSTAEPLEVNVARVMEQGKCTIQKLYFTGRTFPSGNKSRVCATVCVPNKKTTHGALFISASDKPTTIAELVGIAQNGFVSITIDIEGRTEKGCGTMYPEEIDYCNKISGKDIFYFGQTPKQSQLYEYSYNCMRAITYLVCEHELTKVTVVTTGQCSPIGMIVCAIDKRVTNGVMMFGKLHIDYPEMVQQSALSEDDQLNKQLAYNDIGQAWTIALAPQSYAPNVAIPIYVINSANSPVVDIMDVNKMYFRVNNESRMLILPDVFDCLTKEYINGLVPWCKGEIVQENYDISYFTEDGNYFVKLECEKDIDNVAIWYCTNADSRAKHWVKAVLQQRENYFVAKLDLYESNCNVVAFAQLFGNVNISTSLLTIPVTNAQNLKLTNNIVFMGESNQQLLPGCDNHKWVSLSMQTKRKKGYLGIVGMQGKCLSTFALSDSSVRATKSLAVSFDVCCSVEQDITVSVMCNYGFTNDTFTYTTQLSGDGKWQRITVDVHNFRSVVDNRAMDEQMVAQLLAITTQSEIIVNNVILV